MKAKLTLRFLSFWHAGTGLGDWAGHDAAVIRDHAGLPYYPGKSLRGVLRNAVEKAQVLGWFNELETKSISDLLFGSSHLTPNPRQLTTPGTLYISNATLPTDEHHYLSQPHAESLRKLLFETRSSTGIDEVTNTAVHQSLRAIEMTIPLNLESELELGDNLTQSQKDDAIQALTLALSLIEGLGSKRTRGLGRVELNMEVIDAA
jgi:CRISPR/Cas system CSM-associated protein Csm3 (group 7 of RAMP superfamily)